MVIEGEIVLYLIDNFFIKLFINNDDIDSMMFGCYVKTMKETMRNKVPEMKTQPTKDRFCRKCMCVLVV